MLLRALIVLLVVLNLGVAAWWATQPPSPAGTVLHAPPHAPTLRLLREVRAAAPAIPPPVAALAAPTRPPTPLQCFSIGPFADSAALERVRMAIAPRVARVRLRASGAHRGWRVWLPPLADHAAAIAMAARIDAAGFKDYYVMPDGSEGNSIALGRFGNEQAARRQQAALQAAGFAALAGPVGDGSQWIDVAIAGSDTTALRRATGTAAVAPLDCTQLAP